MANALAFAFRRGLGRAILVVGLIGFIWAVGQRGEPHHPLTPSPKGFDVFPPQFIGSPGDILVAAAVLVLASVLAALIWRSRSTSRSG